MYDIAFTMFRLTGAKECQEHLRLRFLYYIMKHFTEWIEMGYYDYCDLPYGLKTSIVSTTKSIIRENYNRIQG